MLRKLIQGPDAAVQFARLPRPLVFTNGVFDILHRGHVEYLEEAAALGDRLIIGLNSDSSVQRLGKGPDRPLNDQDSRALVLASLRCVDAIVIFEEDMTLARNLRERELRFGKSNAAGVHLVEDVDGLPDCRLDRDRLLWKVTV